MTTEFIWQLPTSGDGRYSQAQRSRRGERAAPGHIPFSEGVSDPRGDRFNYFDYLHQVARAADITGFDGVLVPHDLEGDESWIVAGYLARGTRHVRLIAGFDAGWGSAVYAAKNAVSFQRATDGRFGWQIVAGADEATRRRHADNVPQHDVLARIDEFVTVARGVQTSAPYDFKGRFFEVQGGGFRGPLGGNPLPPVYLGGTSEESLALSARQADVHVFDAAPVGELRAPIARLRELAQGRSLAIGLRIDVLAREDAAEAEREAALYLAQSGQERAGFERRTLVGSYDEVEQRLAEYAEAGVTSFVLGATPHLEEAWRFGEHVLPRLRSRLNQSRQAA
ncbi:LLM class flavin-dependent oxidoreductase [Massilia sp. CFBP9012]|uniref:LLM class flavin-dependent oxidoreductase n=1 Tax=Massilia sp. CFBP9012 TaxID=3096531 RepID=UPI002A6B3B03|nr:LLM class flavin-dependent oxidoreductase [Massilia sp. CFBP9012]MDY0973474.1 LLM class flavin-dependent oxidoreductase [Massilia sp. CFBP9012]